MKLNKKTEDAIDTVRGFVGGAMLLCGGAYVALTTDNPVAKFHENNLDLNVAIQKVEKQAELNCQPKSGMLSFAYAGY